MALAGSAWFAMGADPAFLRVATSSPYQVGLSNTVTVTAHASNGSLAETYSGPLTLTAISDGSVVPMIGGGGLSFTNGMWVGAITFETNSVGLTLRGETTWAIGEFHPLNVLPLKLLRVALRAQDIVWDSSRQRIFASAESSAPVYSNSVVRLDPVSGTIEASVPVGPVSAPTFSVDYLPGKLALSDNGQYLYVAISNATFVRRVDLATMTAGPSFGLGDDGAGILNVADMAVISGQPASVAVVFTRYAQYEGLVVFDNGVRRPISAGTPEAYYAVAPSPSAALLYASGSAGFCRMILDASGISLQEGTAITGGGTPRRLKFEGGLCFTAGGAVIDPTIPGMLGKLTPPTSSSLVAPDTARQRVCYIGSLATQYSLRPNDLSSFVALKALLLPNSYSGPRSFIRCGPDKYAFCTTDGQIVVVESPLLTPSTAPSDVAIAQVTTSGPIIAGSNMVLTLTISNAGPALATDVVITDLLDTSVTFISGVPSQGETPVVTGTRLNCNLGNLATGATATLALTLRPTLGGWFTNHATVVANEADTNMANNVSFFSYFSGVTSAPNSSSLIRLPAQDLIYATNTGRIYVSVSPNGVVLSNAVVPLDPFTGQFDPAVLSVIDPGRLVLSDDSQMLYAGTDSNRTIWRIELPAGLPTLSFPVGVPVPYKVDDMAVLPGQPNALAISRRRATGTDNNIGIAIYDDGVPRGLTTTNVPQIDTIEFGLTANELYAYNRPSVGSAGFRSFRRLLVGADGVSLRDTDPTLITGAGEDIRSGAGRIFTTGGSLIDPQTRTSLGTVGSLQTSSLVEPDSAAGRVYYLIPTTTASQWTLRSFDLHTLAPIGAVTITNVVGTPSRLIRWGGDGLAFRTSSNRLHLLRTSLAPAPAPLDLGLACNWSPMPATVGSNFVFTVTVTNRGPLGATNVIASLLLPPAFTSISVSSAQGMSGISNRTAFCRLPALTNGGTLSFNVQVRPSAFGLFRVFAGVVSTNLDASPTDNALELSVPVNVAGRLNQADELSIAARDLALDRASGRLLASATSFGQFENSIFTINPATGQVDHLLALTNDPGRLAVADDGSALYVANVGGTSISRVDLAALTMTPFVDLASPRVLQDMETVPGSPISLTLSWLSGSFGGIEVYDAGIRRTNATSDSGAGPVLEFGSSPEALFVNAQELSGLGRLKAYAVGPGGLTEQWWVPEILADAEDIRFDAGLLYTSRGKVINPEAREVTVTIPGLSADALVAPARSQGRVCYLTRSGANWWLQAYDPHTLGLIGSLRLTNVLGTPSRLIQWETNGFAFRTSSNQVFLLRTDLLPSELPADLQVSGSAQPPIALVGSNLVYTLTATNSGPAMATNVVFTDRISDDATFGSATSTRGTCTYSNKVVRCGIGQLAPGESVTITVTVVPQLAGQIQNLAGVQSTALDSNLVNNAFTLAVTTLLQVPPNQLRAIRLPAAGLVYDESTQRLYASVTNYLSPWRDNIVEIDPRTGGIQKMFATRQAAQLALSEDAHFLYAVSENKVGIARYDLSTCTTNLTYYVQYPTAPRTQLIGDLAVVPGAPQQLAVVLAPNRAGHSIPEVALFNDNIPAPNTGSGEELEFISGSILMGIDHNGSGASAYRMNVLPNGLTVTHSDNYLITGQSVFDSGLLYTSSGRIVDPIGMTVLGTLPVSAWFVEPQVSENRIYYLGETNSNSDWALHAYEANTRQPVGSLVLDNFAGDPGGLLRCGDDFFAFRTTSNVVCLVRSSLVPPLVGADSDADGLPDTWEVTYGLDILSAEDAPTDADRDGMSNEDEFRAGTNPTNAASVFRLSQAVAGGELALRFPTVFGRFYRIEKTETLPASAWISVLEDIPGTGTNFTYVLPTPAAPPAWFYRAVVKP